MKFVFSYFLSNIRESSFHPSHLIHHPLSFIIQLSSFPHPSFTLLHPSVLKKKFEFDTEETLFSKHFYCSYSCTIQCGRFPNYSISPSPAVSLLPLPSVLSSCTVFLGLANWRPHEPPSPSSSGLLTLYSYLLSCN